MMECSLRHLMSQSATQVGLDCFLAPRDISRIWNSISSKCCLFYSGTNPRIYGPLDLYCWRCGVSFRHPAQGGASKPEGKKRVKITLHTILVCICNICIIYIYRIYRLSKHTVIIMYFDYCEDFWLSFLTILITIWLLLHILTIITLSFIIFTVMPYRNQSL